MFSIVFKDLINPRKIDELDRQAENEITLRGYDAKAGVPSDLKNKDWFLPVSEIVSDYCPSERYIYLRKLKKEVKREPTWSGFTGTVIDNLYKDLFDIFQAYVASTNLKQLLIQKKLEEYSETKVKSIRAEIEKYKATMIAEPTAQEIEDFLEGIYKLSRFESQICGAILDFKISTKRDINLKAEASLLFPFTFKPKIYSLSLGFSGGVEPDFLYGQNTIGEIKTGLWREMFNLACAAYALAYECENLKNMNLMIVINPIFDKNRTVPLYSNFEINIIQDIYRKTVIALRDKKLELIKKNQDPGRPTEEKDSCKDCSYYNFCWKENGNE